MIPDNLANTLKVLEQVRFSTEVRGGHLQNYTGGAVHFSEVHCSAVQCTALHD